LQAQRRILAPEVLLRQGLKTQYNRGQLVLPGSRPQLREDMRMTHMRAIEVADGDRRAGSRSLTASCAGLPGFCATHKLH
jgi:hypothetical protein